MDGGLRMLPDAAKEAAESCSQVVAVKYTEGSRAEFAYFRRDKEGWQRVFACEAQVGKSGVGKTREGDMKTPLGTFNLTTPFGILPAPSEGGADRAMPYLQLTEQHYWCGQSGPYYNRLIDNACPPEGYRPSDEDEHLIRFSPAYNYAMFIDYNREGRAHLGSCIFLHCFGRSGYTAGCVAVEEGYMKRLVAELEPGAKIVIYE